MKAKDLILRCLISQEDGQWIAMCLDFTLAAQADTPEQARRLLLSQIEEYLKDALVGVDREHASELLSRRAPVKYWIRYWMASCIHNIGNHRLMKAFRQPVPLSPAHA